MSTPGGATWIHAKTHAWADYYPMVHWSPADIQLEHHLATLMMEHYGMHQRSPIRPALERGIRRYGPDAWKGELKGIRGAAYSQLPRLIDEILTISDGTLASISGENLYARLDKIRNAWLEWAQANIAGGKLTGNEPWQVAWKMFAKKAMPMFKGEKIPSYRRFAEEYNPFMGDDIKVYWADPDEKGPRMIGYVTGRGRSYAFQLSRAQWRNLQRYHLRHPMRIGVRQIIPGWRPTRTTQRIMVG